MWAISKDESCNEWPHPSEGDGGREQCTKGSTVFCANSLTSTQVTVIDHNTYFLLPKKEGGPT
jgi:hypothetical protein